MSSPIDVGFSTAPTRGVGGCFSRRGPESLCRRPVSGFDCHSSECRNPGRREWKKAKCGVRYGWRVSLGPRFSHRFWIPAFAGMTTWWMDSSAGTTYRDCPLSKIDYPPYPLTLARQSRMAARVVSKASSWKSIASGATSLTSVVSARARGEPPVTAPV